MLTRDHGAVRGANVLLLHFGLELRIRLLEHWPCLQSVQAEQWLAGSSGYPDWPSKDLAVDMVASQLWLPHRGAHNHMTLLLCWSNYD